MNQGVSTPPNLPFKGRNFLLCFDKGALGIDEGEEYGTDDQHSGYHVERQVVVARLLYQFTEQDATAETT